MALVALLLRKGDRDNLKSYRPLGLTNTDCGVLAFVLDGGLQTVVDKLMGKERSAYVEGRFVGMGARLVIDI